MDSSAGAMTPVHSPERSPQLPTPPHAVCQADMSQSVHHEPADPSQMLHDEPFARQKRKRTSVEDAAILAAAYQRDPKPDKAARLELVSKVALGEKEVQIWFQNRRQTSRRKSRPLLPHEIAQYQMSRAGDPDNVQEFHLEQKNLETDVVTAPRSSSLERPESSPSRDPDRERESEAEPASTPQSEVAAQIKSPSSHEHRDLPSFLPSTPAPQTSITSIDSLANRSTVPSLRYSFSEQPPLTPPMASINYDRRLKKHASVVRLSMNAEGKAEIVTKDASSPSPPRPRQVLLPDAMGSKTPSSTLSVLRSLQRSSSGRSRDSRSWEFWCDKEARTELGNTAEKDASGSAAGAIELLRTASGRNILGAVPSKRNYILSSHSPSAKRINPGPRRALFRRISASPGRLQGNAKMRRIPNLKHSESTEVSHAKGADSDKENWSPDPARPGARGRSLGRGASSRLVNNRVDAKSHQSRDDQLSSFIRRGEKNEGVSGTDDLDCVQGLLSLSQGNWR